MRRFVMVVLCSFSWIASAHAQTCAGSVPFAGAPLQAGVEAAFSANSHSLLPGVAYGKDPYLVRGAFQYTGFSFDESTKGILGMGGAEYKVNAGTRVLFACPLVTLAKIWGPDIGAGFDISSWLFSVGGSVGFVAMKTGQTTIVPTAGLSFNRLSTSTTGTNFLGQSTSDSDSTSFGSLQFGVGLLFNDRMSLVPSIIVPFGLDGGETAFSVLFSAKIGQ